MKLIMVIALLFSSLALIAQDLQFYKEDLTFTLRDSSFKVNGLYYFCNIGEKEFKSSIYYPFPVDSLHYGLIDSVMVETGNKLLPFKQNNNKGIYIPLFLESYKSNVYRISYRQRILKNKATYILITTQAWKRPLEQVTYRLNTPSTINIKNFSYKPDTFRIEGNSTSYYWEKKDFYPAMDLVFEFEVKK